MLKLLSFSCPKNPVVRVGALVGTNKILDLSSLDKFSLPANVNGDIRLDMNTLIDGGDASAAWVRKSMETAKPEQLLDLNTIKFAPPIPVPRRNLLCVGKNYKDHVAEVLAADKARNLNIPGNNLPPATPGTATDPNALPKYAQFFTKAPSTVVPHRGSIESHSNITKWLDYEAELAVVIGKKGRDISAEQAMDYVFGYTIANDCTSRDIQRHHNQWFKGKTLDNTCPMGPYIVHHSSPINPQNLSIKLWLNNEKKQDGHTSNMIFEIPEIIRQLSVGLTLFPGDIILTGTPQGVGYAMKPPRLLQPGDNVRIEIENIGTLETDVA